MEIRILRKDSSFEFYGWTHSTFKYTSICTKLDGSPLGQGGVCLSLTANRFYAMLPSSQTTERHKSVIFQFSLGHTNYTSHTFNLTTFSRSLEISEGGEPRTACSIISRSKVTIERYCSFFVFP